MRDVQDGRRENESVRNIQDWDWAFEFAHHGADAGGGGVRGGIARERTAGEDGAGGGESLCSLALTGHRHGTDRAVLLGLSGELPDQIAPESIEPKLLAIRAAKSLALDGSRAIGFDETTDLLFHKDKTLPFHSNGMRYRASDAVGAVIEEQVYFSIGGGFILREGEVAGFRAKAAVKYPFTSAAEHGMAVWQRWKTRKRGTEAEIREYVQRIWKVCKGALREDWRRKGFCLAD